MKETEFIGQNKEKWNEMEHLLASQSKDPDRLTNLFIETTDDLSFSRTYYPNRSVRVYLNSVAQQVFQTIYKNKNRERGAFRKFWNHDIPQAMWYARKPFLYSFLIFTAGFLIGIYSSIHYPEFARIILGDYYIEMTEANIEHGDPMAVYGNSPQIEMFLHIAWNNIRILFWTYALGILFGVGTIYIVLYNSIMVGTFIYFFIERNLLDQCFYAVMLHGTIELSMIIIGGAAGLTLGRGLIFPGTYSRLQALLISARQSIKILLAASIFLVVAAFIESFATRYTGMPDVIRGAVIFLSLAIIIGYFIWYPRYLFRKGQIHINNQDEVLSGDQEDASPSEIKSNGKIFTEVFSSYSKNWKYVVMASTILTILLVVFNFFLLDQDADDLTQSESIRYLPWFIRAIWVWGDYGALFNYFQHPLLLLLHVILLGFVMTYFSMLIGRTMRKESTPTGKFLTQFLSNFLLSALVLSSLLFPSGLTFLILVFAWPLLMFISAVSFIENKFFALGRALKILSGSFWRLIGLFLSCLGVQWLCLMISSAPLLYILVEIVDMNVSHEMGFAGQIFSIVYGLILQFAIIALLPLCFFAAHLFYVSALEVKEGARLRERIQQIGFKKRAYGLEKES